MVEEPINGISAFDLDNTLISSNSSYDFGKYLCKHRYLPVSSLFYIVGYSLSHTTGLLSIERLHHCAFERLFKGRSAQDIRLIAMDFLDEFFGSMLYVPAIEALRLAQDRGHLTVLLSSGPEFLVGEIAKRLNIPLWHSTQYAIDKDSHFCHISKLMLGADKARILENLRQQFAIRLEDTFAYSDSHLDLPMLKAAGNAIAVNPNKRLRRLCQHNLWPIL